MDSHVYRKTLCVLHLSDGLVFIRGSIKASVSYPHLQFREGMPMVGQLGVQVGVNLDDNGKQTS